MAERFKIMQALDPAQFATDNSSVQIVAARVLEDIQDNSYYLQVKFSNSGNQILSSLDISVQSNNTKVALWHYADLNLKQGDSTGSKTLIPITGNMNYTSLKIIATAIQFINEVSVSGQDLSVCNEIPEIMSPITSYKISVDKLLLLATVIFLVLSLAFSFFGLFRSNSSYVDDCYWRDANLFSTSEELSDSNYVLPFTIPIGIYGYLLSTIIASLFCLFIAKKSCYVPFIRITPFLPFGFQIFLVATLSNRSFVYISDTEKCDYFLTQCTINNSAYYWILCTGVACCVYAAFLIHSYIATKKSHPLKKKINIRAFIIIIAELIVVLLIPLVGISAAQNHTTSVENESISATIVAINPTREKIAAQYGLDGVDIGEDEELALTQTNQSNIRHFLEKCTLINSTTGQQIGTLYCIGVIDKNDVDSSFYRVFWKITDSSLTEVNAENSNDDNNSASSESPEYSGYWYNGNSTSPYYLSIEEDSSGSFLNIEVYSDHYKWTATARPSATDTFTYDDGFQQSYLEDFNLPDLEGTITFDFDKHTVTWKNDSDETVTFTTSISASDFNSFVEKVTAVTESYSDDSQPTIEPIDLAGHYWCEQNSGDAYISIYSAPEDNQEVGNIEVYSQLEKANFSDVLYYVGDNTYETTDGGVTYWRLFFYSYNDTPAFELYYVYSPDGSYQDFGEYIMDEHYYS